MFILDLRKQLITKIINPLRISALPNLIEKNYINRTLTIGFCGVGGGFFLGGGFILGYLKIFQNKLNRFLVEVKT